MKANDVCKVVEHIGEVDYVGLLQLRVHLSIFLALIYIILSNIQLINCHPLFPNSTD